MVVPAYQRVISDHERYMHVRMRVTVHVEELRPCTRYVFLVLAGDGELVELFNDRVVQVLVAQDTGTSLKSKRAKTACAHKTSSSRP